MSTVTAHQSAPKVGGYPIQCPKCQYMTAQISRLRTHAVNAHHGNLQYQVQWNLDIYVIRQRLRQVILIRFRWKTASIYTINTHALDKMIVKKSVKRSFL